MKLSEKLDSWINYLESIDAPKPPEPSIARDYPQAWKKLQKRRIVFKWTVRVMVTWIFLALVSGTYSRFVLELPPGKFSKFDIGMMFLAFGALLVQYIAGHFYCLRCKELFCDPDLGG